MHLFSITKAPWVRTAVVLLVTLSLVLPLMPIVVQAQGLSDGAPTDGPAATTNQPPANGSWCEGWLKAANPMCWVRGISVAGSMAVIYISGLILGIAGALMNASIELTTVGFDSQIYARIQPGIEAVWTVFRDIANIVIIGMFTFIALTMILGIEKFNARQMVAKVLLIAILINFSLLFTRLIIQSSNFVAIQFYKAAQFGAETSSALGAAASFGNYTTGISGKFGQLMGVTSPLQTGDALWKAELGWWDPGVMTLALGMLTSVVMVAAALMFFYIAFLLIARSLLFIFLLITSSLAFASYLVPNGGGFAGYGWDSWWKSLLKNAVFAPLLFMLLWATIQIGTGIKAISGSGTIGGLLGDPSKGGNINALFSYILILGMLYVSVKIASKFAHEIGGFNYAALAPAYGAGLLGRLGGVFMRNTAGRGATRIGESLQKKSQDQSRSLLSRQLYDFGSQQMKQVAKRDFNLMRGQLGHEIQGTAGVKKLDAIAGKAVKGFEGAEKARAEAFAEKADRMKLSDDDLKKMRSNAAEAVLASNTGLGKENKDAQAIRDESQKALEAMRTQQKDAMDDFSRNIGTLSNTLARARTEAVSAGRDPSSDRRVKNLEKELQDQRARRDSEMRSQQERIKTADERARNARVQHERVQEKIQAHVAETIKDTAALAKDVAHNRFTNALFRATGISTPDNDKLAKMAAKAVGDKGKKQRLKDLASAINEGGGAPAHPPPAASPTPPTGDAH
jgi:hypothetical protein